MSSRFARPCRRMRSEIMPLASVSLLVLSVVGLFPKEALRGVQPARERPSSVPTSAGCAFVTLDPLQERTVLAAARTSWQGAKPVAAGLRAEMLPPELPEIPSAPVLDFASRPAEVIGFSARPHVRTLPPTVAAPPPSRLAASAAADAVRPVFPREMLLELSR